MSITACVSHKEDVDVEGITKTIILVDYPNIVSNLDRRATSLFPL
jgi:hypothetical protein